jgi:nickel-dependent lactate racemase
MPDRADIVVIDSYPADRDFWQSAKGYYAGTMAVKRGGVLILVSPNPEGVASNHPNMLEIGYRPHAQIVEMVQQRKIEDLVGGAILADVAQIVDHAECFLVSPGVKPEEAQRLGLHWAASAQEALAAAIGRTGNKASVAVLRHGGHVLPIVATEHLRGSPGGPTGAANPQPGQQARQER